MRSFAVRAVLITLLTISLFFVSIFFVIIPALERGIMDQKREMIRELTNSAWNILAKFHGDEKAGLISREEAQKQAVAQIRNLHYGQQMKDYFWINDLQPRMVVHPYRSDLDGKDLTLFADPDGKKLFVEAVKIVREQGMGYLNYRWQWKDDATRIVPKLSYVKGFEPWDWLIGTGVYLEDLQQEIRGMRQQLVILSLGILLVASFLLFFLLWDSLLVERKRRLAEQALRNSEVKYRTLVEASGECIVLAIGGETLYANQSMLGLLECSSEYLQGRTLDDIFELAAEEKAAGGPFWRRLLQGEAVPAKFETRLKRADGEGKNVTVSLSRLTMFDKPGVVVVTSDITRQRSREVGQERLLTELQSAQQFLHQPLAELLEDAAAGPRISFLPADATLASLLADNASGVMLPAVVQGNDGAPAGLLTMADLTGPDWEERFRRPLKDMCSRAPIRISETAPAYEAFLAMERTGFAPALVTDGAGRIRGLLTERHLAQAQRYSPVLLQKQLERTMTGEELARINRRLFELVGVFVGGSAKPAAINRLVTQNSDTVLQQAIRFATARLGPPPAAYAFMVLGSSGRLEQTLKTDQDNAIIYEDLPPERGAAAREYFLAFGSNVCEMLASCGYALCDGKIMASNPEWCQPLSRWKVLFERWITTSEAQDLLQTKIFFDFRAAAGDARLVEALRPALNKALEVEPRFFFLLARNVLIFQPPLGLFGNFLFDPAVPDRQVFDIKGVMALIVDFARIYALKHRLPQTNTHERLEALTEVGALSRTSCAEMRQAYEFLMSLRLASQVRAISGGRSPDNYIEPQALTSMDQKMLKEVLAQIKDFQVKLSFDFTGSMMQQV